MYLMVLNDGETYTNLDGCMIVEIPDDYDTEGIEEELKSLRPFQEKEGGAQGVVYFEKGRTIEIVDFYHKPSKNRTVRIKV